MAINVSDVFKIADIPTINGCDWSVSWAGYGTVTKPSNQAKLLDIAMRSTMSNFGISLSDGRVCWISPAVYYGSNIDAETLADHLNIRTPINGVAFADRHSAEKFVEAAEQMIIMNLLTRVVTSD